MAGKDIVDPRLTTALRRQLASCTAGRIGWKLGVGDAERIGETPAVGHLTAATLLEPGATYDTGGARLHADAEVAVVVGVGYAPSLELVDLGNSDEGPEAVVATNIFHRAVAFGDTQPRLPPDLEGRLLIDGVVHARGDVPRLDERLSSAAAVLATVGEKLSSGDRLITGSVVQIPVERGQTVTADFGVLGKVSLELA